MSLTFDNPNALWLLVLVPVFYAVGRLGTAYLARPVRNAAILIRLLVVTALILSIARPVLHRRSDALSVVFVADRSASVAVKGVSTADAWIASAVQHAQGQDVSGVVDFGGNAIVRRSVGAAQPNPALRP